jgi:GTP-binding protein
VKHTETADPTETPAKGRVVAIVGRPNVGKSAIFNRLAGQRIAIVHAMPGVTRDRLMREVVWDDQRFSLVDTGGISSIDGETMHDKIEAGIRDQAQAALQDAAVAILVVDITVGLTPLDEEVARLLRQHGTKVFVAANKADESSHDAGRDDFTRLGYPAFPVSALHGRGFNALMDEVLKYLPSISDEDAATGATASRPLHVAIVGRPNAGKSSYINRLLNSSRVLVSEVPGTTRDSIDVPFTVGTGAAARHYVLIDTAGARRQAKVDTAVERYSRFRTEDSIERADIVVLMLDVTRGVGLLDKQLASKIQEEAKGCLIIVNKWDLAEETQRAFAPTLERDLPFMAYCPVVYTSAETGYNIRQSVATIDHVADQTQATLPTGVLNRVITEACAAVQPPARGGRPARVYYATQVSCNPVTVRVFVNDPARVPMNYRDYLINQLRRHFGLEGAPVRIQLRERERPPRKPTAKVAPAGAPTAAGARSTRKPTKKLQKRPAGRKRGK